MTGNQSGTTGAGTPAPVRVHRGADANALAGALDARAFTHAGEVFLPASHGPIRGPKAQSLLAHELTHVAQQRRLGSGLPHEDSPHGRHLESEAVAAEKGGAFPLAIAVSGESSAQQPTAVPTAERPPAAGSESPPAAHAISGGAGPQRARSANDAKFTDPEDAFRAQLDSNEDYLFDRFERRLRFALIHERERGGTLIDAL